MGLISLWKFRWFGGIYDDRLQFRTWDDALGLDGALEDGDVSHAWSIWSSAAEGLVPDWGLVFGRVAFLVRKMSREARRNFADPLEGGNVFTYHDTSTAVFAGLEASF